MSFGQRLLQTRKDKKLSQDKLAKALGVHGAVIGRYERDEVKPSIEMATKIARVLEVSLDYLVGNSELKIDKSTLLRVVELQKLSNQDQAHIFAMIDAFLRDPKTRQAYAS